MKASIARSWRPSVGVLPVAGHRKDSADYLENELRPNGRGNICRCEAEREAVRRMRFERRVPFIVEVGVHELGAWFDLDVLFFQPKSADARPDTILPNLFR
jgi:hypothetical protein